MTEDDVDPENPRPEGHYPRFADNEWHYVCLITRETTAQRAHQDLLLCPPEMEMLP